MNGYGRNARPDGWNARHAWRRNAGVGCQVQWIGRYASYGWPRRYDGNARNDARWHARMGWAVCQECQGRWVEWQECRPDGWNARNARADGRNARPDGWNARTRADGRNARPDGVPMDMSDMQVE